MYAYAVALAVWAVDRFIRESNAVERSVDQLAARPEQAATPVFGGMASTRGPLALTLVFAAVTVWRTAVLGDPWVALLWLPVTLLVNLPLLTAVWVYLALLLGLDRLGRRTLSLTAFPQDLSLGLGEVGRLAFTAFWIYGAGFAPVLLINLAYPLRLLLLLGLFLLGVLVFFACLQGLHRQLLAARRHYLGLGRPAVRACIRAGSVRLAGGLRRAGAAPSGCRGDPTTRRGDSTMALPATSARPDRGHGGTVVTFVATGIITRLILVRFGL